MTGAPLDPTAAASAPGADVGTATPPCSCACAARGADDELRVPFWIMLTGFGAGAFWALAGVAVGRWVSRR